MHIPRKGVFLALEYAIVRIFNIGIKLLILCKPRQTVLMKKHVIIC